jgi:DNA modification methylase
VLRTLPEASVHCVVTSPPYWGLRDYKVPATVWGGDPGCEHEWGAQERGKRKDILPAEKSSAARLGTHQRATGQNDGGRFCAGCGAWLGQLGLEPTPELYVAHIVEVFREVRRVLRDDGTLWLNLGDSYTSGGRTTRDPGRNKVHGAYRGGAFADGLRPDTPPGLKAKDLVGIPWRVAFALQADGWYLRSDIVWAKPNPMPESVEDRPTKAHEYVFLLSKRATYFWDAEAVRERDVGGEHPRKVLDRPEPSGGVMPPHRGLRQATGRVGAGRNIRSVWTIATKPFKDAHFATFPPELPRRCILAGTSERGCCPTCGAPWKRVIEREPEPEGLRNRGRGAKMDFHARQTGYGQRLQDWFNAHPPRTVGWQPGCRCYGTPPLPPYPRRPQDPARLDAWEAQCAPIRAERASLVREWAALPTVPCTVLDPFAGSGTVGHVAAALGRDAILIELSDQYAAMAERRVSDAPLPLPLFVVGSGVNGHA